MKIVSFEEGKFKDDEVVFDDISIKYTQNADCTEDDGTYQELDITSRNNGTARFINIKTEGWSIDNPNDLVDIINDFCKRADINITEIEEDKENK